jgi:hypothetical protein
MAGKYLSLMVHFVWSTDGREPWITAQWNDDLYKFIGGIFRKKNSDSALNLNQFLCSPGVYAWG